MQLLLRREDRVRGGCDDITVDISRIRRIAECNLRTIGLVRPLHVLHETRSPSECNGQDARRRRIECPRMTHALLLKNTPHNVNDIVRRKPRWFQHIDESVHS